MKKLHLLSLLLLFPLACFCQFIGLAGQYSQGGDGQFAANISFPSLHGKNKFNSYVSSGLEFTTSGGSKMSGLNLKPIQISTFFSEEFFNAKPYTALLSVDAGYLIDFRRGKKDGIVITPNLYVDYKIFFMKAGYDFDISHGRTQFFVRAGIGIGMSALKMFGDTKIW